MFEAITSLNIKDKIYTAAQPWEDINKTALQKSRKKICPSLIQAPENPDNPDSQTAHSVRDLQAIQSDIQSFVGEEWLVDGDVNSHTNEDLVAKQIIDVVVQQARAEEESDGKEKHDDEKITHSAA